MHGDTKVNFSHLPNHPVKRSRPLRAHEKSSIFSKDDITQIKTVCKTRPVSATYQSSAYGSTLGNSVFVNNVPSGQGESTLWSDNMVRMSARKCCKDNQNISSSVFHANDSINEASVPIWSAEDQNVKSKASRSLATSSIQRNRSFLFNKDKETSYNAPLWSSDFKSTSRPPVSKRTLNVNYKSTVFSPERLNASLPKTVNSYNTEYAPFESSNDQNNQQNGKVDGTTQKKTDMELISQNFSKTVILERNDKPMPDVALASSKLQI